ncbi:MAG: hypothetical protein J7503_11080 [Cellulomonas iranensis]|uniref:uroporphyrinogen decarboxylase family protein n=1 Tax=Cellulomonas iranensis TaxID=76862 RepID=UPI001B2E1079|nr:uroporphyrinogen decarboxylase family protein [Cellulomonas iranensis]MBO9569355.1 hypothetical protein [Cellulomonas iranensis]
MTPAERVRATLAGERPDRPAVTVWRHWPGADQDAAAHVDAEVRHRDALDLDVLKLTPSAAYLAEGWGARTVDRGDPLGVRDYLHRPVSEPAHWHALPELVPADVVSLQREITTVRLARARVGPDVPVLPTVFSPLSVARYLAGEDVLLTHLRDDRAAVVAGLATITRTLVALVEALVDAGADGVYLSLFPASHRLVDAGTYREVALDGDRQVLEAASATWLRVVHFHLPEPLLEVAPALPAELVSWEHTGPGPALAEGMRLTGRPVLGGVDQVGVLRDGTPADVRAAVRAAWAATGGRLVVAPACSYPLAVPPAHLRALVEETRALGG